MKTTLLYIVFSLLLPTAAISAVSPFNVAQNHVTTYVQDEASERAVANRKQAPVKQAGMTFEPTLGLNTERLNRFDQGFANHAHGRAVLLTAAILIGLSMAIGLVTLKARKRQ